MLSDILPRPKENHNLVEFALNLSNETLVGWEIKASLPFSHPSILPKKNLPARRCKAHSAVPGGLFVVPVITCQ